MENNQSKNLWQVIRDPGWEFVGVVLAIIFGLIAIYQFILGREVVALQIVVLSNTSLIEIEPSIVDEISIEYQDQPVDNLSLIQIKLENTGNQEIRVEDYDRPITFTFPSEATIIEASVTDSSPDNIGISFSLSDTSIELLPVLLNPGDSAVLRFLVLNIPAQTNDLPFSIDARIARISNIDVRNIISVDTDPSLALPISGMVFFFLGILSSIWVTWEMRNQDSILRNSGVNYSFFLARIFFFILIGVLALMAWYLTR